MHTRNFFIAALLLPLPLIISGLSIAVSMASELYVHLMLTSLIAYSGFSSVAYFLSRKLPPNAVRRLGCRSPVVYLVLLCICLSLEYALGLSPAADLVGLLGLLIFAATYVVIGGYLYVLIAEQVFISYLHQQKLKNKYKNGNVFVDGKLRC